MRRKFIKAMAVAMAAMLLMSSTLVYAGEGDDSSSESTHEESGSGDDDNNDDGSNDDNGDHGDSGSGDEGSSGNEGGGSGSEENSGSESTPENNYSDEGSGAGEGGDTYIEETPSDVNLNDLPATDPAAGLEQPATEQTGTETAAGTDVLTDETTAEETPSTEGETETKEDNNGDEEEKATFYTVVVEPVIEAVQSVAANLSATFTGEEVEEEDINEPDKNPTIDGGYIDWSSVELTDLVTPEKKSGGWEDYQNYVNGVAWMQKGDYIYIYIEDSNGGANAAGANGNGNWSINTDLGYKIVFQLNSDGTVTSNVDGITAVYSVDNDGEWVWNEETQKMEAPTGHWEIRVSNDVIPENQGNISFGLYNTASSDKSWSVGYTLEMTTTTNSVAPFNDETNDAGYIDDWTGRAVVQLDYTTAGTDAGAADGFAAQYGNGDQLYGMATTTLPAHTSQGNYCVMEYKIYANDITRESWSGNPSDWQSQYMCVRLVAVDSEGNINWNPTQQEIESGEYEYHIFSTAYGGGNVATYADYLQVYEAMDDQYKPYNQDFGKALVTIKDGEVTVEWYIDSEKYASYIDATYYGGKGEFTADELKEVTTWYHRIGGEVTSTGASSGPVANAGMCLAACLIGLALNKKKLAGAVQKAKAAV